MVEQQPGSLLGNGHVHPQRTAWLARGVEPGVGAGAGYCPGYQSQGSGGTAVGKEGECCLLPLEQKHISEGLDSDGG